MAKKQEHIDIEIIWKAVHHKASNDELKLLHQWAKEDPAHTKYLNSARSYFEKGSAFSGSKSEINKGWKKFETLEKKNKNHSRKLGTIAASVAASVILIIALFQFTDFTKKELIAESQSKIKPGTEKATLILNDGRSFNLAKETVFSLKEDGATIISKGTQLEYEPSSLDAKSIKYNTVKVPRGGEFFVLLSDGTKVWLNAQSSIRYPVQFPDDERRIELTGEAYFEVYKNTKNPFRVITRNQQVEVLGTRFNISSYTDDHVILTTLIEGSVEVSLCDYPTIKQILIPNEQSFYAPGIDQISKRVVNPQKYISWKEGRYIFEEELLGNIMKKIEKWYDVEIIFTNTNAKNIRFTGNLERYANIENILAKIEKTNEVEFKIEKNKIIIE